MNAARSKDNVFSSSRLAVAPCNYHPPTNSPDPSNARSLEHRSLEPAKCEIFIEKNSINRDFEIEFSAVNFPLALFI